MMAGLRTLVLELIRRLNVKNIVALLEKFQDDFQYLIYILKELKFL